MSQTMQQPAAGAGEDAEIVSRRDGGVCATGEVITAAGLTKTFPGDIHAVVDLDLHVRAGEIFGLLGPNGAGKTTTVGMLSTRVVPTAGSACVGGVDVVAHPALAKQAIGVVAQSNTL
ncbi:MAG TPA: ATP-binding cassette domain-containing protein, partial [Thermoleophilia bacterium]